MKISKDTPMSELHVIAAAYRWDVFSETIVIDTNRWNQIKDTIDIPRETRCECCNKRIRYICVVEYLPMRAISFVGCECAKSIGFFSRSEFKDLTKRLAHSAKRQKNLAKFKAEHPDLVEMLDWASTSDDTFVKDVYNRLQLWGTLSERQIFAMTRKWKPEPVVPVAPVASLPVVVKGLCPTGKQTVTGTVISTRQAYSRFGYRNTMYYQMLVELPNKARAFGTMPKGINAEKGDTVTFTAIFEPTLKDTSFGYFKRPAKV